MHEGDNLGGAIIGIVTGIFVGGIVLGMSICACICSCYNKCWKDKVFKTDNDIEFTNVYPMVTNFSNTFNDIENNIDTTNVITVVGVATDSHDIVN